MGARSKRKGSAFERAIAADMQHLFGDGVRRGMQDRHIIDECDVEGTPYWLECKVGKCQNPRAALRQAIADSAGCGDERQPVAIIRDNSTGGGKPSFDFAVIPYSVLMDWMEKMRG